MTDLESKLTVCIVTVTKDLGSYLFGVYDNEELARKRVEELNYLIPEGSIVKFNNDIVWKETEAEI